MQEIIEIYEKSDEAHCSMLTSYLSLFQNVFGGTDANVYLCANIGSFKYGEIITIFFDLYLKI